jgi:glycosyltransferase involved in cell wall biosynthesis
VNVGGSLSVARALVREQRRLGLDARLVLLYREASEAEKLPFGPEVLRCGIERSSRWTRGIYACRQALTRLAPDLIHHHDGILWPRLATMTLRKPMVTHGHLPAPSASFFSGPGLTHAATIRSTDRLIAISDSVASSWEQSGFPARRIRVVPNGVDTRTFFPRTEVEKMRLRDQLGLPRDGRILLWVGRLHREMKGLERVVSVASLLREPFCLVIVGDGPDRSWLETELKRTVSEHLYRMVGKAGDTAPYFGCADLFLFTSHSEPFGLVLLEAAASGLPLFAFACEGGGRELLKTLGATTVQADGARELANHILGGKAGQMDTAGAAELAGRDFSWESATHKIVAVYRELFEHPLLNQNL